jgi:hypothetical protein
MYFPVCFRIGFVSVKLLGTFAPFFVVAALWIILFLFYGVRLNTLALPPMRKIILGNMVVQAGFCGETLRTLWIAQVRKQSSPGWLSTLRNSRFPHRAWRPVRNDKPSGGPVEQLMGLRLSSENSR